MVALHTEGCRNIRCQDLSSSLPVGAEAEVVKTMLSLVKPFQSLLELGFSSLSSSKYLVVTCILLLAGTELLPLLKGDVLKVNAYYMFIFVL